jgi:hypothetical protein
MPTSLSFQEKAVLGIQIVLPSEEKEPVPAKKPVLVEAVEFERRQL